MKELFILLVIILFPVYVLCEKSILIKKDTSVVIQIKAEDYKGQVFKMGYPFLENEVELDSKGEGTLIFPIKDIMLSQLDYDKKNKIPLLLESGYTLLLTIINGETVFTGNGATANNYLQLSKILEKQYTDSIFTLRKENVSPEKFINTCMKKMMI